MGRILPSTEGVDMDAVLWIPIIMVAVLGSVGVYWAYWYGEVRPKNKR